MCGWGNDLGYGKNVKDVTMDNPQPSPKVVSTMDAVQRLDVGGEDKQEKNLSVFLKV